ncbi:hypothetical protein D4764_09G0002940 [Takifugu flavidus]|uniref:Uncharacterized protein n=1 Tax=Takifugu flavidus TaxID=433684 RepID=A0A5C6MKT6_9TELE|nr:hypothetical protein D4764_09G0002940 [Takifugu flavidus]
MTTAALSRHSGWIVAAFHTSPRREEEEDCGASEGRRERGREGLYWDPGVQQTANTGLLHPYNMVTASPNNNQLDAGFMNKWSIPRRPYFPRFSLFS